MLQILISWSSYWHKKRKAVFHVFQPPNPANNLHTCSFLHHLQHVNRNTEVQIPILIPASANASSGFQMSALFQSMDNRVSHETAEVLTGIQRSISLAMRASHRMSPSTPLPMLSSSKPMTNGKLKGGSLVFLYTSSQAQRTRVAWHLYALIRLAAAFGAPGYLVVP